MEGVASGRSGRTSNRYNGTTTTTTTTTSTVLGPVRKWSKNWVPIIPTSTNQNNNNNNNSNTTVTHLRLYKWTPLSKHPDTNNINISHDSPFNNKLKNINYTHHTHTHTHTPPKKFKFVPIAVLEELKEEKEKTGDEAKLVDGNEDAKNGNNKKPDINDLPMEDNQDSEENKTAPVRQDLNELDLSLGLTAHEEEHEFNSKTHPNEDSRP